MKLSLKILKLFLVLACIWLTAVIIINIQVLKELASFGLAYNSYRPITKDPIPHNSSYGMIYSFTNLLNDTASIPVHYINGQEYNFNYLPAESKVNYRRMKFIINFLEANQIEYSLQLVPAESRNAQVFTSNIFVNPSRSNDFKLLTAHYDVATLPNYQGAMDNSASVIVLLNIMKTQLLKMKEKKVAVLFTTLEEEGLLGAEAFMKMSNFKITSVICLDGIGRGQLGAMNISAGSFGIRFQNLLFQNMLFTGSRFKKCPEYKKIDKSVIDFEKLEVKPLTRFLCSTDAKIFSDRNIPTVSLVSSDIVHFVKVLHTDKDKVNGLNYKSLIQCENILANWIDM